MLKIVEIMSFFEELVDFDGYKLKRHLDMYFVWTSSSAIFFDNCGVMVSTLTNSMGYLPLPTSNTYQLILSGKARKD